MARVRIRMGENEVEVDSRDFYVDNRSIGRVIEEVSGHLQAGSAAVVAAPAPAQAAAPAPAQAAAAPEPPAGQWEGQDPQGPGLEPLGCLDEAEIHEPEFSAPVPVSGRELEAKLRVLEERAFFDTPRTASETVGQLREGGWIASPLEVSKTLTGMVFHNELVKNLRNNRSCYSVKASPAAR